MTDWLSNIAGAAYAFIESSSNLHHVPEPEPEPQPQAPASVHVRGPPQPRQCHHNLLQYSRTAVLPHMLLGLAAPPLPPDNTKSLKNPVFEQHELYRHLEIMNPINDFEDLAKAFTDANIPSTTVGDSDLDAPRNSRFSIPAHGYAIPQTITGEITTLPEIVDWVRHFPLTTVRRLMHMLCPETLDYKMQHLGTPMNRDKGIMECFKWAPDENAVTEASEFYRPTVMFFVQPPWMLSSKDLDIFVCTQKFPNPEAKDRIRMRSHERVWSKIYDGCTHNHAHFFVLTTYREWVFGAFSKEHSQAWTSDIMPYDSKDPDPTIVEYLFYWLASATAQETSLVNPWTIPKVYEPIFIEVDPEDERNYDPDASLMAAPSVSDEWEAYSGTRTHDPSMQDSDGDSSTTAMDVREDRDNPDGDHAKTKRLRHGFIPSQIENWTNSVHVQGPVPQWGWLHHPWIPESSSSSSAAAAATASSASTTSSESSASSVSTVRDYAHENRTVGTYLVGGPGPLGSGQPQSRGADGVAA
ncbi:hypothetical protein LXA43DRAFT_696948 [Ganoderma leucocontextum]|nr:hypothetical protein LXA43DRAFT_696948 [Ganoderma leucocontextum]